MPILSTFGGASIRAYGFSAALPPAMLPANTILLWSTTDRTSPPSGWSNYTTADGRFLRGSFTAGQIGTQVAANTSAVATVSVVTSSSGAHTGPGLTMQGNNTTIVAPTGYLHYNNTSPTHTHTSMTASLGSVVPDSMSLPVIQTTSNAATIPANTVIFRKTIPSSGNYIAYDTQMPSGRQHAFFRGGSSRAYANASGYGTGQLNSSGTHTHLNNATLYGAPASGGGAGTNYVPGYSTNGTPSTHSHTADVPLKAVLKSRHLNAWISPVVETVEYGTIVMYVGDLTELPAGWRLCDGTLGTPNMTDYFIGSYAAASHGDSITDIPYVANDPDTTRSTTGAITSTDNTHSHFSGTYTPFFPSWLYNGQHASTAAAHTHTITVAASTYPSSGMAPDHLLVAFIQYKGI